MKAILALDPGRTTGYAIGFIQDRKPFIAYSEEQLTHKDFFRLLYNVHNASDFGAKIVCESFHFRRGKTGIDLYPCELIGVLHYFVAMYPMNKLYFQEPSIQSESKAYFSNKRLKEMGLYQKEYEHGRSAVKHMLHFLQFGNGASQMPDMDLCELVTIDWVKGKLT